jgi:opacity protein-like surface antigen
VEASVGASNLSADCAGTASCKTSDVAYKLVGGFYRLNPVLSAELGYLNFGKASVSAYVPTLLKLDIQSEALFLGLALRGELGADLAGSLRLGVANVTTRTTASNGYDKKDTNVGALFGLGVAYKVSPDVSVVAGIDFTHSADVVGVTGGSLRMISAGARYSF